MEKAELLDQVRRLRAEGRSPKEIARALDIRPSAVAPLVRAVAAQAHAATEAPELVGCWINVGWNRGLSIVGHPDWLHVEPTPDDDIGGLVGVLIARRHRWDKVSVCGYLVDVYCLGVKNAFGPDITDDVALRRFLPKYFDNFLNGWKEEPIRLAQEVVFGAVEYARGLGFEPHADFMKAADHLGTWEGPSGITFGKQGKPYYISGPYDNQRRVIDTLHRAVGPPPNFEHITMM
jgi:hypothetical protein